jgi:hypothetical protein
VAVALVGALPADAELEADVAPSEAGPMPERLDAGLARLGGFALERGRLGDELAARIDELEANAIAVLSDATVVIRGVVIDGLCESGRAAAERLEASANSALGALSSSVGDRCQGGLLGSTCRRQLRMITRGPDVNAGG